MSNAVDLEKAVRRQDEHIKELERTIRRREDQIRELEKKIRRKDDVIKALESASDQHRKKITELTSKVDQYQSVMTRPSAAAAAATTTTEGRRRRAVGISGESVAPQTDNSESGDKLPKRVPKSSSSRKILEAAIEANEFLNHLSNEHVEAIIDYMFSKDIRKGDVIIREGDTGSHIYVLEEGEVEVSKGKQRLRSLGPKNVFGELAILYNCTRTASVKALTNCRVWAIDRKVWQAVTIRIEMKKRSQCLKLLKKVPILSSHSDRLLSQIADRLDEEKYDAGQYIVRQGAKGETFFIVKSGTVLETRRESSERHSKAIRTLKTGDFFGEKALEEAEDSRKYNYVAGEPEGAVCLILERESYRELIGSQSNGKRASMDSQILRQMSVVEGLEFPDLSPEDVTVVGPLGFGGFSRVELVELKRQAGRCFALKTLTKHHIVETKQEQHTLNERNILAECKSDFIVRLYATMKDGTYLYLLLEACLGGELFTVLKNNGALPEESARFYASCVLEALQYLHSRGIVYRDLKPENLMLDNNGYLKLTDFGFAKKIGRGQKTWTFCGTPEYIAPEVILNRGHDMSVDLWALGVLLFELLVGRALFAGSDQMQTYKMVLKGVDAVDFPREIKKQTKHLIKKLCRDSSTDRLGSGKGGASDVRRNKWFDGFNWEALRNRTLAPPVTPQIRSSTDLSNFENCSPGTEDIPPDYEESVDWDPDF